MFSVNLLRYFKASEDVLTSEASLQATFFPTLPYPHVQPHIISYQSKISPYIYIDFICHATFSPFLC